MNQSEYKTLDINEASALYCLGYRLLRLEKTKPQQRAFIFSDDFPTAPEWASKELPKAKLAGADFKSRCTLMVDAYSFAMAFKEIKNRLFTEIEIAGEYKS